MFITKVVDNLSLILAALLLAVSLLSCVEIPKYSNSDLETENKRLEQQINNYKLQINQCKTDIKNLRIQQINERNKGTTK